jgi:hypothetical protein
MLVQAGIMLRQTGGNTQHMAACQVGKGGTGF